MNVKTIFLNGDLKETIFITQSEGYEDVNYKDKVYHLKKYFFGLKQSPRQ